MWRRKWQPTPVFLLGESQGRGSLVGCHLWGYRVRHDWSDLAVSNSRITEADDRISEVEDRMVEINESERKKEKWIKRNEDNLRDLQDSVKRPNIRIIGVPEEEDKKNDHEKILEEIIVENFPKMGKEIITQVQETQRVPNRINLRRNTPRHMLIKLKKIKHKEQILKEQRKNKLKEMRTNSETSGTMLNAPTFES